MQPRARPLPWSPRREPRHAADEPGGAGTDGAGTGTATAPRLRIEAFPAATPGTRYVYVHGDEFHPLQDTYTFEDLPGVAVHQRHLFASLAGLPTGARITEVTFAVIKSAGIPGSASYFMYLVPSNDLVFLDSKNNTALPQSPDEQYVSLVVDPTNPAWVVDNEQASTHQLVVNLSNSRVNSVRVGYIPGPTTPLSFVPIAPKRAYDSRFVAPLGPLPNNTSRVISVANGYVTGTGTLETSDIIPATARAIAYNLTIANTVGQGFLSVNPGDAAAAGGSSINWFDVGSVAGQRPRRQPRQQPPGQGVRWRRRYDRLHHRRSRLLPLIHV